MIFQNAMQFCKFKNYKSAVLNTKILPITLTREQTYSLTPTKLENGYLAIYRNDETKKKTKFLTIQFSVTDERVSDD